MKTAARVERLMADGALWFGAEEDSVASSRQRGAILGHNLPGYNLPGHHLSFGVEEIDAALPQGGLAPGTIHEWAFDSELSDYGKRRWYSPLLLVAALASRAQVRPSGTPKVSPLAGSLTAWVGKHSWATPHVLERTLGTAWQQSSFFINPPTIDKRLWTLCELIRSSAVRVIVADGERLPLLATRRLQLALKGKDIFFFLLRPAWELPLLSTAQTKWLISTQDPSTSTTAEDIARAQFWKLELLRCRSIAGSKAWNIMWTEDEDGKTHSLRLSPNLVNRSDLSADALSAARRSSDAA